MANGEGGQVLPREELMEQQEEVRFERPWFYVAASILAWVVFWDMADRHQEHIFSRLLAWSAVLTAIWAANNL